MLALVRYCCAILVHLIQMYRCYHYGNIADITSSDALMGALVGYGFIDDIMSSDAIWWHLLDIVVIRTTSTYR